MDVGSVQSAHDHLQSGISLAHGSAHHATAAPPMQMPALSGSVSPHSKAPCSSGTPAHQGWWLHPREHHPLRGNSQAHAKMPHPAAVAWLAQMQGGLTGATMSRWGRNRKKIPLSTTPTPSAGRWKMQSESTGTTAELVTQSPVVATLTPAPPALGDVYKSPGPQAPTSDMTLMNQTSQAVVQPAAQDNPETATQVVHGTAAFKPLESQWGNMRPR